MLNLKKAALAAISLGLIAVGVCYALQAGPPKRNYELVSLEQLPGVSKDVLVAQGSIVQIVTPIVYFHESSTAMFEVTILDSKTFSGERDFIFQGDASLLQNFVSEVRFVQAKGQPNLLADSKQIANGAADAVSSIADGIWNIFRHPIDTAKGTWGGVNGLIDYMKLVATQKANLRKDAEMFARAFFVDTCTTVAGENGFSYLESQTPEARLLVQRIAIPRISGDVGAQVLSVFVPIAISKAIRGAEVAESVPSASKLTKLTQLESGTDDLVALGKAFSKGDEVANALARLTKFETASRRFPPADIISALVDPDRLKTLHPRALNPRLHKLLYHLNAAELNGNDVVTVLRQGMKASGADKRNAVPYLDPEIDFRQILGT